MGNRIGIDLGGTKIEGVILDASGAIVERQRIATPQGYPPIVSAIAGLVTRLWDKAPGATVGIGTPGSSDSQGRLYNSNTVCLNGMSLQADIEAAIGAPVRIANDANCLALSEASDGAARDAETVFAVILGTGVGGGIVVRRHLLTGAHGIAGEWGHNVLDADGPRCYCGQHGCVETFLSGPAMQADFLRASGRTLDPPGIVTAARGGDPEASACLQRYLERFGRALAVVINILDPDCIVLAGGLSHIDELYSDGVAAVGRHVFHPEWQGKIVRNHWGDSSGVRGAAWLWDEEQD